MVSSKAYDDFIKQMQATGRQKLEGYNPNLLDLIEENERNDVENLIYTTFMKELDTDLAIFLPKLKKYDGITLLKQKLPECNIPSDNSLNIAFTLWDITHDKKYLNIIMDNYNNAIYETTKTRIVGQFSCSSPNKYIYNLLVGIYVNSENTTERSSAIDGILYNKNYLNNPFDLQEVISKVSLTRQFYLDNKEDRKRMIEKLESNELIM